MSANKPTLEWKELEGKPHLRFKFERHLSADDCRTVIAEWRQAFDERPGREIPLIWEASSMKGYDSEARKMWQEAMRDMKDRIAVIWLVTESPIVNMGASVMSLFSSIAITVVKSEDEIAERLSRRG